MLQDFIHSCTAYYQPMGLYFPPKRPILTSLKQHMWGLYLDL